MSHPDEAIAANLAGAVRVAREWVRGERRWLVLALLRYFESLDERYASRPGAPPGNDNSIWPLTLFPRAQ